MIVSLDSSSSSDDDVFEYLPIKNELGCIRDLYVAKTKLVAPRTRQRHHFWGLFCHREIKKGQFIGMYRGDWHNSRNYDCDAEDDYCLELNHDLLVTPGSNPDPQEYPIAMANEPNADERANAVLVEYVFGRDDVSNIPADVEKEERFFGAGLVACCDIKPNTEIKWHYGPFYDKNRSRKNYTAGEPCDIWGDPPHPVPVVGLLPYDAVSPFIDSRATSPSSSSDTPKYGSHSSHRHLTCRLLAFFM